MEESSCHPHPALLLGDILEVMFRKLPFEELKKCRLICRKWEESSRFLMKSRSQLRLSGSSIHTNFLLNEFLRLDSHFFVPSKLKIQICSESELNEYIFDIVGMCRDVKQSQQGQQRQATRLMYKEMLHEGLEDIYEILGRHSIEELEIYRRDYSGYEYTATAGLINILGRLSPTLKSLQICAIPKHAVSAGNQILIICSSLTKLSIGDASEWFHDRIFSACPNLQEIIGVNCQIEALDKTSGGLKKISGFTCATQEHLEILERKSGNLTELSLEVEGDAEESILEFLQSKKDTLQFLELKFRNMPETLRLGHGLNQLTKLQLQFEMRDCCLNDDEIQLHLDICFSRDTPQLKCFKLEVSGDQQNWEGLFAYRSNVTNDGRVIPLRTLTHLNLSVGGRVNRECADYLRQLFPSLLAIKIKRPTEDFLRGLWQMQSLVELHMDLQKDHLRDFRDIEDLGVALFGTPQEDQEVEESILNLKKLRFLSILKYRWNRDGNQIPEETVRNGFGRMRSLAVLKLPEIYLTPEGSGFLSANLPNLKELKQNVYCHLWR